MNTGGEAAELLTVCEDAVEYAVFFRFLRELLQVAALYGKDF